MRISRWADWLAARPSLSERLKSFERIASWQNIAAEARPFLLAPHLRTREHKALIVTGTYERCLQWQAKLTLLGVPESLIRQLPTGISSLFEDTAPEAVALSDRIGALRFLTEPGPGIVIATAAAVLERTLPVEVLQDVFIEIEPGQTLDMGNLSRKLAMMGYEVAEPVRTPGQYSRRGGILDVFPVGVDYPVRVEFFDELVESLRQFDPNSQRSVTSISRLRLSPSRETLYAFAGTETDDDIAMARGQLEEMLLRTAEIEAANLEEGSSIRLEEKIREDAKAISQGVFFDRLDLYRPLLHPDSGCAVDLLGENGLLILDESTELAVQVARSEEELGDAFLARQARGEILKSVVGDYLFPPEHLASAKNIVSLTSLGGEYSALHPEATFEDEIATLEPYRGRPESLATTLKNWIENGFTVVVGTDQPTRAKAVLSQVDLFPREDQEEPEPGGIHLSSGNLASGFVAPAEKFALVTDQELFGVGRLKLPQRKFNEGAPIATVLDLKSGDYVVHINFGIGIFQGLVKRNVGGIEKECLFIQYAGPDKLFVPADQLDRVQKYLNPGDSEPKINRLQGGEWQKAVGKAREEARAFARDLIQLYAKRKDVKRQSLGPDSPWQSEMEATFPWVETPSQVTAIREVKRDLETDYPMDRLVCGDVGFGKTEVAIRAAFKVAQAGKQVAVLCPTTILSEQHARNFAERLAAFPTKVELLNRFRTAADRKEVLRQVELGEVDILIGTHALLANAIKFKNLGLVIIDEEHKFGVKQKEALKALRVSVDVLSMSATPIPRTLSMALMDIRQMSLINDPPPGRLSIRTVVRPFSLEVVREAILRELARNGQVYYVSNRVQGIYHVADKVKKMVPNARIGVGHGQMTEAELEPVMLAFIKGELDVLISTTIIENGLDISNANTMIVENADKLGLSQLYQLRGRVGRSDRQAYAYLLYQNERSLSENALARLQSLQEFSSLGSGYGLAFRDLQIRGAGDLLGAKQSGTMASVGYELFAQIINEEILFLKSHADGDGTREYRDPLEGLDMLPTVDLPVVAMIPELYIEEQAQRLYYYKAMMSSRSEDELEAVQTEIIDRYGSCPAEVNAAFRIMRLRMAAREFHVDKIDGAGGRLSVTFRDSADFPPRFWSLLNQRRKECFLARGSFVWPYSGAPIDAADQMLRAFQDVMKTLIAQQESLDL